MCVCVSVCVLVYGCSGVQTQLRIFYLTFVVVVAAAAGVAVTMKRSSFSSSADSGVYGGGSRSASSASLQGTYTISNPPGASSFFNRPQHQQQQQQQHLDPNGNVFTNYGFSEEVLKRLLFDRNSFFLNLVIVLKSFFNIGDENVCFEVKVC